MSKPATPIFDCASDDIDPLVIERAGFILRAGGVLAYPTETFYGLAVHWDHTSALTRLGRIKSRPPDKPFPLILASAGEVDRLCASVPPRARELMARYWPGPLTLVLPAALHLHASLVSPQGRVGLRLSPHPLAAALALACGGALTATSANLAGEPPVTRASDLDPALVDQLDGVLDGGATPGGLASTVVEVTAHAVKVLRPGPIRV